MWCKRTLLRGLDNAEQQVTIFVSVVHLIHLKMVVEGSSVCGAIG